MTGVMEGCSHSITVQSAMGSNSGGKWRRWRVVRQYISAAAHSSSQHVELIRWTDVNSSIKVNSDLRHRRNGRATESRKYSTQMNGVLSQAQEDVSCRQGIYICLIR